MNEGKCERYSTTDAGVKELVKDLIYNLNKRPCLIHMLVLCPSVAHAKRLRRALDHAAGDEGLRVTEDIGSRVRIRNGSQFTILVRAVEGYHVYGEIQDASPK